MSRRSAKSRHIVRRDYGKSSPLDLLPKKASAKLLALCDSPKTFAEIRAWLLRARRCKTSDCALSTWYGRIRRERIEAASKSAAPALQLRGSGFEIVLRAPGCDDVRVVIRPLPGNGNPKRKGKQAIRK